MLTSVQVRDKTHTHLRYVFWHKAGSHYVQPGFPNQVSSSEAVVGNWVSWSCVLVRTKVVRRDGKIVILAHCSSPSLKQETNIRKIMLMFLVHSVVYQIFNFFCLFLSDIRFLLHKLTVSTTVHCWPRPYGTFQRVGSDWYLFELEFKLTAILMQYIYIYLWYLFSYLFVSICVNYVF